jgi:hypothetical protein
MVSKTPPTIKAKVISEWLKGTSPNTIAKDIGIGAGTVTDIHQQARNKEIPDIDLMRALALMLKKENLDLSYFASAVRLKKVLDRLEVPEETIELLLEEINIYCFKREMNEKEFISKVNEIFQMAYELEIPIADVLVKINQKASN